MFIDTFQLDKQVRLIIGMYFDSVYETEDYYNVKCNICQDKHKKRAYILKESTGNWVYYCHNCGTSISVNNWMKTYFYSNYKSLKIDVMRDTPNSRKSGLPTLPNLSKKEIRQNTEKSDTKYFKKLTNFDDCVQYCESRKIPKECYSDWFYATGGIYKGRIVIPFRDDKGKIYYYQARTFNNISSAKYLSRIGDHNNVYNYYNVDKTKSVVMLEGPIDAMFVENAIALTGLKVKNADLNIFPHRKYLLDNDDRGKEESIKLLKKKMYVFNWYKFLTDNNMKPDNVKDVNDFILKNKSNITKLTLDIIDKYFTKSINDSLYFKIKT